MKKARTNEIRSSQIARDIAPPTIDVARRQPKTPKPSGEVGVFGQTDQQRTSGVAHSKVVFCPESRCGWCARPFCEHDAMTGRCPSNPTTYWR